MDRLEIILKTTVGIWLVWMTVWDIKEKQIPVSCLVAGALLTVFSLLFHLPDQGISAFLGFLAGFFFLICSKITKEQIGKGDSICLMFVGIMMGIYGLVEILSFCFGYLFVASAVMLIARKKTGKQTIPFFPFLLAGYLSFILLNRGGIVR